MKQMMRKLACCLLMALLVLGAQQLASAQQPQPKKAKKAKTNQAPKKAQGQPKKKEITPEMIEQVTQAMPKAAVAQPKKAHKVLVFCLTKGFPHDSIPIGAKAFEIMGKTTGAFEAVVSTDLNMFNPENIAQFDGIIMNNTTGSYFFYPEEIKNKGDLDKLTPEKKAEAEAIAKKRQDALVEFVKGGKGLIGVHSATDCEYDTWPQYGEMMGGYFAGHPWHCVVPFKIDDPANVINKPFDGKGFSLNDEIYIFKAPYDQSKLHKLVSLDTPNLPPGNTGNKARREDGDYAVSWIKPYGQGHVFYCSLGHEWAIFWTAPVLDHYLRGIQYALGDLQADDAPTKK